MANKRMCKHCKKWNEDFIKTNIAVFCDVDCAYKFAVAKQEKEQAKLIKKLKSNGVKKEKAERAETKQRKKELMTRSQWYNRLQGLVNQYVRLVRDINEPCCTCGTSNPSIKYDAGHFFTRAARSDIRFELTNIHKQCSVRCNQHGSGMRNEHEKFIIEKYGQDHLDWLILEKPPLKEQFPNWQDIELEILRYRKLLRENGVTPNS